ncbi:MAG TPA: hypothetical protein VF615_22450 [Longimicrobiaceae bacterium]|jgi:hypothetical protein
MTKRIGKLQLNRESVRRLTAAPPGAFDYTETEACASISYCVNCITVNGYTCKCP